MAVNIQELVEINIRPVMTIDETLAGDIPKVIEAQTCLQGYDALLMDDKQRFYVAALTLESLVPRLALVYTEEIQEHRTGPEVIKLPPRGDFFKALQKAIETLKTTAGRGAGVLTSVEQDKANKPWPGVGIIRWV